MMHLGGMWPMSAELVWRELGISTVDELDLVCCKLGLKAGNRVLDLGCGWGGFARFAAEHYGVSVVGITMSRQQASLAQERCAGLPIEIRLADYRQLDEPFHRI